MTDHPGRGGAALVTGIGCAAGAGALWGLVFLAPALVRDFSPLQLAIGRYLAYGLFSVVLLAPRRRALIRQLTAPVCGVLAWLAFCGNALYYVLLSGAVQIGGIAMTSLVIGFMPVAITLIGSRDQGAVPLRRLGPSLLLCVAGAACIGWQSLGRPLPGGVLRQAGGLACAAGALACWTSYAVVNSRWLAKAHPALVRDWNSLIGVMTGLQTLLLVPLSLMFDTLAHTQPAWARFWSVSAGVALIASLAGNALWNRMTQLLPLTLTGQMILFETVFALLYGLLWERRWPTGLESAAFVLVVLSVLSCVAAHRPTAA